MTAIERLRLAMQRTHPCTNGRCGHRTYGKSSIYSKSSGKSSMYCNSSMPPVCTCIQTKHPMMVLERRSQKPWGGKAWRKPSSESKDRMAGTDKRSHVQPLMQWMGGFTWMWIVSIRRVIRQIVNVRQLASRVRMHSDKAHNDDA